MRCSRKTCFWPGVTCELGHLEPPQQCKALKAGSTPEHDTQLPSDAVVVPWSGGAMGLVDLGFVAGCSKPIVLAVIGPQNSGKTTLLAAWYLLLGRGDRPGNEWRFSGSYSLAGWETVASFLRWAPGGVQPTFPPHTSSSGRMPGLLHLAFIRNNDQRRNYVMTDAPGEWFSKWAINRGAQEAEGARWVAEHADAFLLIADREALSGSEMGSARSAIQMLSRRLADERRGRPVALVWTKEDVQIDEQMEVAVRDTVRGIMPDTVEFAVSVMPAPDGSGDAGQGLLELLHWAMNIERSSIEFPESATGNSDPFFMFGTS